VGRRRSSAYDASVGHLNYAQPDAFNDEPRCRRCLRLSTPKQLLGDSTSAFMTAAFGWMKGRFWRKADIDVP
jgi:hypothetical protein